MRHSPLWSMTKWIAWIAVDLPRACSMWQTRRQIQAGVKKKNHHQMQGLSFLNIFKKGWYFFETLSKWALTSGRIHMILVTCHHGYGYGIGWNSVSETMASLQQRLVQVSPTATTKGIAGIAGSKNVENDQIPSTSPCSYHVHPCGY